MAGRAELDDNLRAWIAEESTAGALKAMADADVVAAKVFDIADIFQDDIYAQREDIIAIDDQDLGTVRMQGVVPRLANNPGTVWRTGPALGQDNDLVLGQWLGLTEEQLEGLRNARVV